MNISRFYNEHKMACILTCGFAIVGYIGCHVVKWIIHKIGLIAKVDKTARDTFKDYQFKVNNTKSSQKTNINKKNVETFIIKNESIDLKNTDFPDGVTQYKYPKRAKGENIPQACTFISAAFLLYMKKNFDQVVKNFANHNVDFLIQMRKDIIDNGLNIRSNKLRNNELKKALGDMALHPEELSKYTDSFETLKIGQPETIFTDETGDTNVEGNKEFAKLFSKEKSKAFCLIQADGQTFAYCQINEKQAFLFDSHKSWFKVVSNEDAKNYVINDILHKNPFQGIDLYHGFL